MEDLMRMLKKILYGTKHAHHAWITQIDEWFCGKYIKMFCVDVHLYFCLKSITLLLLYILYAVELILPTNDYHLICWVKNVLPHEFKNDFPSYLIIE